MCVQTDSPERNGPTDHRGMLNSVCQFPFPLESARIVPYVPREEACGRELQEAREDPTAVCIPTQAWRSKQAPGRPSGASCSLREFVMEFIYLLVA